MLAALAILGLAAFMGGASAQPTAYDLGECVASPRVEALHPSGLYTTHGPGTFGRDLTSPAPPHQLQGALTVVGHDSWTLSRWITQTTAIGDGCAGYGLPPVHGGGIVTVGVWMRTVDVPGYANITLTYWDEHVRFIGSTSSDDLVGTTDWTPMHTGGVIPDGTRYIRIEYRLSGPGALWVGGSSVGSKYGWITYPFPPAVNLTPPSVAGLAEVGQLLTADPGTWQGGATAGYRFEWYRCDAAGRAASSLPTRAAMTSRTGPTRPTGTPCAPTTWARRSGSRPR